MRQLPAPPQTVITVVRPPRYALRPAYATLASAALLCVGMLLWALVGPVVPAQPGSAVPTLQPTPALAIPPQSTLHTAQPQIVNDGNGNVTITNNYTYVNAPVDVCVALICEANP